ncbi:LysR family transcriptional regulator [Roseovarius sp.]|uniref:LysR family transcriptional regulator n=1 Tax=Roseovarius sp. TaxID=1486281 RepID=UPI003A968E60
MPVAIGLHGNTQNAACNLGRSQPDATKVIQDPELDFEIKLFGRTNRPAASTILAL